MKTYENEKHFLRRDIDTIFLMMGNECNLNCRYCLQHPLIDKPISHEINPDIYNFIEQVCKENINIPLDLRFWGGEPLVFFPTIVEVVTEIRKRNLPVKFSTMSNGKLLNEEIVNFLLANNFNFSISWDGRNSIKTRGYDVIANKKDLLFRFSNLYISAVLSAYAYPKEICEDFQSLDNEYYNIHNKHLMFNVDDIFNTGDLPQDLLDIDYNKISNQILELSAIYLEDKQNRMFLKEHYAINTYIGKLYNSIKRYYKRDVIEWNDQWCCCGNGYTTLNMGIDGNLYPCHNTSHSVGSIYDGYFKYLKNLISEDSTFRHHYDNTCTDCPAICYCRGGCKLVSDDNRSKSYCNLKRAIIVPLILLLQEYGKELD